MSLHKNYFIFDGIPCTEYGLMIYDFGSNIQGDISFPSTGTIVEDRVASRYSSLFYGLNVNAPLTFNMVFGANPDSINNHSPMDRFDVEVIASWLTGHQEQKWLSIVLQGLSDYRYKCVITNLQLISNSWEPWAFSCTVTCDSPYAYTFPYKYGISVEGEQEYLFFNRSSHNGYYSPKIELSFSGTDYISIINHSDNNREFLLQNPYAGSLDVVIDNKNQIITNNLDLNLYKTFNMNFFRLNRGNNNLTLNGRCYMKITCEFPVNVGR